MNERRNRRLMQLVRHVHGLMDIDDTQKNRDSQDHLGSLYANDKKFIFTDNNPHNMHGEWTHFISDKESVDNTDDTVIFYCHGGGYMTGSCLYARSLTMKLAKYTHHDVFCFDYRLAPEHPYPAALEDALAAWEHILTQGHAPQNIIVAGDSAGGNLALALTLTLRLKNMELPKCLVLFSPWTDMTASSESYQTKLMLDPVLDPDYIRKAASSYLAGSEETSPFVSPLFADLTGFPPTYIQVGENESSKYWLSVLNGLKNRGVKDILIICADGLSGIKEAISAAFPKTEYQRCIVHQVRNTLKYVADKDRKPFATDLKAIYQAPTEERALEALGRITEKWSEKYPNSMKSWKQNWDAISPIFKFSAEVRKVIYTTNAIESLNATYRKLNRQRSVFPSDTALLKALYLATFEATKKWTTTIRDWGQVYGELSIMYEGRLPE